MSCPRPSSRRAFNLYAGLLSILFVTATTLTAQIGKPRTTAPANPPSGNTRNTNSLSRDNPPDTSVTGKWQQFVWDGERWVALGVFSVNYNQNFYLMQPVAQSKSAEITNSRGLFDVNFSGEDWTFKSDWGGGDVGEFRLKRIGEGAYSGRAYLRGAAQSLNLWLLISKN